MKESKGSLNTLENVERPLHRKDAFARDFPVERYTPLSFFNKLLLHSHNIPVFSRNITSLEKPDVESVGSLCWNPDIVDYRERWLVSFSDSESFSSEFGIDSLLIGLRFRMSIGNATSVPYMHFDKPNIVSPDVEGRFVDYGVSAAQLIEMYEWQAMELDTLLEGFKFEKQT